MSLASPNVVLCVPCIFMPSTKQNAFLWTCSVANYLFFSLMATSGVHVCVSGSMVAYYLLRVT